MKKIPIKESLIEVWVGDALNNSVEVIKATEKAMYYAENLKWPLKL